ncbi:MAG: hypothetical protein KAX23_04970 [Dehalococcoidia bacterium]|nr:hypothetical protein [Chloroflexota bacterium]MCK4242881.1 hypothetical protein [Dehalococcoidia bacterium]
MKRIESIDARLWQGAGILLVISIGGIALLGWTPPKTKADFLSAMAAGVFSILVLVVWWYIFHRWIHLQRIYSTGQEKLKLVWTYGLTDMPVY